ncbi:hypothetical protein HK103_004313 [Boothiomyces macroporosus]|uniref:Uncharacterized protein n=1 Tax=Boothiomyces macroporosus TaxID=261099 RepID=A0AAD5UJB7_9FUNG|nr:hypothetical protein HK103_004313 [Boothiomyces macroporosus]
MTQNEEAGKLLLEDYDEYAKRARLMTGIHAKQRETESNRILTPSDRNVSPQKRPIEIATNLPKKIKNEKKSVRRL